MHEIDVLDQALEVVRQHDNINFSTDYRLGSELSQSVIIFFESIKNGQKVGIYFSKISDDPIITAQEIMDQSDNYGDGALNLSFNGMQIDFANALLIRMIQVAKEAFSDVKEDKDIVKEKLLVLDKMNIDYMKAGGFPSPVYAEYLRLRQGSQ